MAIIFAISAIPLFTAMGAAIDYAQINDAKTVLQAQADSDALASRSGSWIKADTYRVEMARTVQMSILPILGLDTVEIRVEAEAVHIPPTLIYTEPLQLQLDHSASDYNALYVFCYNSDTKSRGPTTMIADNGGTTGLKFPTQSCAPGEHREFALFNARNVRTQPSKWRNGGGVARYWYYTDDLQGLSILETYRCDTEQACKPTTQGGDIPVGPNRIANVEKRECEPGKYMYYGWEDRPTGGDRDYDDLRIMIQCPTVDRSTRRSVTLTK